MEKLNPLVGGSWVKATRFHFYDTNDEEKPALFIVKPLRGEIWISKYFGDLDNSKKIEVGKLIAAERIYVWIPSDSIFPTDDQVQTLTTEVTDEPETKSN